MPHVPFLKAMKDASSDEPSWQALAAGYLVLRIFDDWLVIGPQRITTDMTFSNIFPTVAALSDAYEQERRALQAVLQMLTDAPELNPNAVVGPLLSYAFILENRGSWLPAADVYQTTVRALEFPSAIPDPASVALSQIRAGYCWANANDYERAFESYTHARTVAAYAKDAILQSQARLCLANLARARGDLPGAETMLDDLLADSLAYSPEVAAMIQPNVLHSRGAVRQARGRYVEAIVDLYNAYLNTNDPLSRELILADLGACASVAGYRDTARDALEVIVLSGRNTLARQSTIVNLIEIAVLDGDRAAFERWRAEWQPAQYNPLTNAYGNLFVARGIERFVGRNEAVSAFLEAARYAENAGIHQVQFEALHDMERLHSLVSAEIPKATSVPPSLYHVAEALADLRMCAARDG